MGTCLSNTLSSPRTVKHPNCLTEVFARNLLCMLQRALHLSITKTKTAMPKIARNEETRMKTKMLNSKTKTPNVNISAYV